MKHLPLFVITNWKRAEFGKILNLEIYYYNVHSDRYTSFSHVIVHCTKLSFSLSGSLPLLSIMYLFISSKTLLYTQHSSIQLAQDIKTAERGSAIHHIRSVNGQAGQSISSLIS